MSLRDLTPRQLHGAVSYADITTLRILSEVGWMRMDLPKLVNGLNANIWTPRKMINTRRLANIVKASEDSRADGDLDPEQVFFAFVNLFRNMVDEHYGSLSSDKNARLRSSHTLTSEDKLVLESAGNVGSIVKPEQRRLGTSHDKATFENVASSTAKNHDPAFRLPLWSTTPCGQRGKIDSNTLTPLQIWNPPYHLDWAAIDELFFQGNNGLHSNDNRMLFSCGATVMTHLSRW